MCDGYLGEIRDTELHIYLKEEARPFRSAPFRAGPKTCEIEQAEVKKQLDAGLI